MFTAAYDPLLKRAKCKTKTARTWPEGATKALQDCFECTDWCIFREAASTSRHTDISEYTETNALRMLLLPKLSLSWFTAELLKAQDAAFRANDAVALRAARINLSQGIKLTKRNLARKINSHFACSRDT